MPQHDRIGKGRLIDLLRSLEGEPPMDLTDSTAFPWWLWLCNVGRHATEIIGEGVQKIVLASLVKARIAGATQPRAIRATFHVLRMDGTGRGLTVRGSMPTTEDKAVRKRQCTLE